MHMKQDIAHHPEGPVEAVLTDVEAFSALVREHQAGLRAFIRALGIEADWVDDVAQEVFLIAYRKQPQFESGKEFGRWLRGIARRLAANERRKEARHARLLSGALPDLLAAADGTAEAIVGGDTDRLLAAMNECLEHLPAHGRDLLCRRYEQGETAPALGLAFKLSPDAVRQMLVRLRAAVKRCVDGKLTEGAR
jgi:RNA polymerase sigma-70 factor, ECF subfamily